jgi:5-methylcytosine-specific restriction endonuclease McrA
MKKTIKKKIVKKKKLKKKLKVKKGYFKLGKLLIPLHKRIKGKKWKALQEYCVKRDGGKICCKKDDNCYGAMHLHHKKPLSKGGSNRPGNLTWICHLHHCVKHPWMIKALMERN